MKQSTCDSDHDDNNDDNNGSFSVLDGRLVAFVGILGNQCFLMEFKHSHRVTIIHVSIFIIHVIISTIIIFIISIIIIIIIRCDFLLAGPGKRARARLSSTIRASTLATTTRT